MTQGQLAKKSGTACEYIAKIERVRSVLSATLVAKFAYALSVKESYFLSKLSGISDKGRVGPA
jgi:transcriptional regulator with XRE-family HTH domain